MFLEQIYYAKLAHLRVNFQSLGEVWDCSLGLLSSYMILIPSVLVHSLKLLLDILDRWYANLLDPSSKICCNFFELRRLVCIDGLLKIVLVLGECNQVFLAGFLTFEVHLYNIVAESLRSF